MSTPFHGRVVNGRVELDDALPEGAEVTVFINGDEDDFELSPEDAAELDDRIEASERGEWIDGDEVLREIRSRRITA